MYRSSDARFCHADEGSICQLSRFLLRRNDKPITGFALIEIQCIFKILLMKPVGVAILLVFALSCQSGLKYPDGGHEYAENYKPEDANFYYLPLRDSFSRQDSFYAAWEAEIYRHYDEPNLSLNPGKDEVFRLYYMHPFGESDFITIQKDFLIVKKYQRGAVLYPEHGKVFTPTEMEHYELLERAYPLNSEMHTGKIKRRIDSLIKIYPRLLDPNYFLSLRRKTRVVDRTKPKYLLTEIPLTKEKYREFVSRINSSGFWQMPFKRKCEESLMDGASLMLEANTKRRYKAVIFSDCHTSVIRSEFAKTCQEIINFAGLGKDISMYWDGKINPADTPLTVREIELEPMGTPNTKKKEPNE
jgi:hypothetical protein